MSEIEKQPLISIQILNWNRAQESIRAINSALNQSYTNKEIVFVDNGSTDDSVRLVKEKFPTIKVIELDKNYGCPGGRNKGIEYCAGDFIFYLDNDGVLHKNALANAFNTIKKYPKTGVLTGVLYDFENEAEINTEVNIRSTQKYYYNNFQGGICLHNKQIYKVVGLYPEHFMYGAEEHYLSLKLIDRGYKIIKDESVVLWHKKSTLARNHKKEKIHAFYNKLYVAITLYPLWYTMQFLFYFPFKYSLYAWKEGCLNAFLTSLVKRYFQTLIIGFKNRSKISLKGYHDFKFHKVEFI